MKSLRPVFIISGVITVVSFAVVILLMFFGPDKISFSDRTLKELFASGEIWGIIVVPIVMIVTLVILTGVFKSFFPPNIKNGVTAPATVVEVRDTGVTINDNPQVGLLLEVKPRDRAAFLAEAKTVVSRLNVALVQPGIAAEVVFDPEKPTRIQVVNLELEPVVSDSSESRLKELNRLYDQGLITGEEYRAKRQEIITKL
jgi:hypothetical protein